MGAKYYDSVAFSISFSGQSFQHWIFPCMDMKLWGIVFHLFHHDQLICPTRTGSPGWHDCRKRSRDTGINRSTACSNTPASIITLQSSYALFAEAAFYLDQHPINSVFS
ncbi:hypothetical protein CsSME_00017431 [Camellia sinensis var. sinensis]